MGSNDHLEGSFVGIDPTGHVANPNGLGVGVFGGSGVIGGPDLAARNVISGNAVGVGIASLSLGGSSLLASAPGGLIANNLIGTDASGSANAGNTVAGVAVIGSGNSVGGTAANLPNVIAFNGQAGAGVVVAALQAGGGSPISLSSTGDLISGNSMFANRNLGIGLLNVSSSAVLPLLSTSSADLPAAIAGLLGSLDLGVLPNVHFRTSGEGPNNLLNYPDLASASTSGGVTTVLGTVDGAPNTAYRLEFFTSPSPDPTGYGEGQTYLGSASVTTDAKGYGPIRFTSPMLVPSGQVIASTAIDPNNNTSEFSNAVRVTSPADEPTPASPTATVVSSPGTATPSPTPIVPEVPPHVVGVSRLGGADRRVRSS